MISLIIVIIWISSTVVGPSKSADPVRRTPNSVWQRQPSRSCAMSCLAGNHFNAHVFLKNVIPVDRVRTHLGLKDIDPEWCFMDLWVSNFWGHCVATCIHAFWICCLYRWNGKFEHFYCPWVASYEETKAKNKGLDLKRRWDLVPPEPDLSCRHPRCNCPPSDSGWQHPWRTPSTQSMAVHLTFVQMWGSRSTGLIPPCQPLDFSFRTRLTRQCAHSCPRPLECQFGIPPTYIFGDPGQSVCIAAVF